MALDDGTTGIRIGQLDEADSLHPARIADRLRGEKTEEPTVDSWLDVRDRLREQDGLKVAGAVALAVAAVMSGLAYNAYTHDRYEPNEEPAPTIEHHAK